ncbi:hypothetical protein GQE53_24635 [Escherichia coli]|uniref:hypothetical protein n=1 Tax=Escherichia coli TaxID=562 RepID=UPI0013660589|nr:hypothetical protein [Escherichia coli]MWF57332.1 hypothetical protein [Escherichia coli]
MKINNTVIAALALFVVGTQESYAYDLPNDVTLKCADNEKVYIHFGTTEETNRSVAESVYMKLPDTETANIPLKNIKFENNDKDLRMDFVKVFDDNRAVVRRMLLSSGSYYKADKTNKLMDCTVTNATY